MRTQVLLLFGLILLLSQSCKPSEEIASEKPSGNINIIAIYADQEVTLDELKTNFNRNRNTEKVDSEIREFYPSYINYRLKLYEGYQQGYHKDSTILAEFNEYASEIANRYWIEKEIKREWIETFKDLFKHELKAFHILKEIPQGASPSDTTRIYKSLLSVRDSLLNGANPEELNEKYSSKREGRPMGGQLSWITAGSTIQPFENALYNLEPGEISPPVRSQFGYHLILLQDIRPRTPQRLVKHIFVRKYEDDSGLKKIHQAYEALEADRSWSEVVEKYTEDPSTRNRDGSLGWVGYGAQFPQELVEAVVQIDPESTYSEPYEMSYGYQVMKVDSVRTFTSEEQKEGFIRNRMKELDRLNPNQQDVYDRITRESDLTINRNNFSQMIEERRGSTDLGSHSELDLIFFNNQTYTSSDFQYWLDSTSSVDDIMQSANLIKSYRNYIIRQNYIDYTRNRFPEFTRQIDHFLEGLVVFKVNEENIWNPEAVDRNELQAFYESNRTDYKKGQTFLYTEISASSDSIIQIIHKELLNGTSGRELSERFEGTAVQRDSTSYTQNLVYSTLESMEEGEFSEPISVNDKEFIYILNKINNKRFLSFEEAQNRVFTDYQPIREEKFINDLKERYNLLLFPEKLD